MAAGRRWKSMRRRRWKRCRQRWSKRHAWQQARTLSLRKHSGHGKNWATSSISSLRVLSNRREVRSSVCACGVRHVCVCVCQEEHGARGIGRLAGLGPRSALSIGRLRASQHCPPSSTRASQHCPSRSLPALSTGLVSRHARCLAGTSRKPAVLKRVPWAQS